MAVYSHNKTKDLEINVIDKNKKQLISDTFNNNKVIKSIKNYEKYNTIPSNTLNKYRTEMFLESEKQLLKHKDTNNIFYLEAPTGCGKSLTSLNLALNLFDDTVNKLYYVAPFNNISEQIHSVISENFYKDVVMVNSREDIFITKEDDYINYDKDFLNSQLINYPLSLISHVRFFDVLFSNNRIKNLMLSNLCNSIIVIDEIQSYKNSLWLHIINTLKEFSEMLNLKIIIMSATLPKMKELLECEDFIIPDLIQNRQYFYDYFKKRVEFDFSLLKSVKNDTIEVYDKIDYIIENTNKHRILIECLTTSLAEKFYNKMKKYEEKGFLIFKMTGLTNSINRKHIISKIQDKFQKDYINKKIILIGTQCIEAGIDIDMQIGFKDISILDADEQFSGRIERNFNDTGTVYFFDIDDGDFLYKGDYRTERNLNSEEWKIVLQNKEFNNFYRRNYKWLLEKEADKYIEYKKDMISLQYIKIQDTMQLINSKTYSFLFMCKYKNKRSAKDILEEYLNICKTNLNYSEKVVNLKRIRKELSYYIYNINSFKFKNDILLEKIDNLYIVENGNEYFDKLERDELIDDSSLDLETFVKYVGLFL